jgi:HD-GYP domain-containing protein (c-di-GMP phosphodiesterase class II)
MQKKVLAYVYSIIVASVIAVAAMFWADPTVNWDYSYGAGLLALVAFLGAIFSYRVQGNTFGEVSFIPYLTAIVLYPSWTTTVSIAATALLAETIKKKSPIKKLFNVAQIVVASAIASAVYLKLGGEALQVDPRFRTIPHVAAVTVFLLINTMAVATAVGLADGSGIFRMWIKGNAASLAYDVVAIPVVYAFARAYVDWGEWGIAVLCALVVGLRFTYQSKHQLETTNKELLELFVHTVEYRDPYTSGHSQRVSKYSRIIGQIVGLSPKEVDRISKAALLHDVGKIHEAFAPILMKPGKLTAEERAIMELHPIKSAELVAKISELRDIVPSVRHHHENWDGSGYPDRLKGTEIPLGSRIIMFADTIDAMLTDRPYRKALSEAEVRVELTKNSGTQFDPMLCEKLVNSPELAMLFDGRPSGKIRSISQIIFQVKERARTLAVA